MAVTASFSMGDALHRVFIEHYLTHAWAEFPVDYRLRMRYRFGLMRLAGPKGRLP